MNYLKKETILGSVLLAAFGWALIMIVGMQSDVTALQVGDKEDKRVNEIVYEMKDSLVRLEEGQGHIKQHLKEIKNGEILLQLPVLVFIFK